MTSATDDPARGALRVLHAALSAPSRAVAALRNEPPVESLSLFVLVVAAGGITLAGVFGSRSYFPPSLLSVVLLFGGLLLGRRNARTLAVVVALSFAAYFAYLAHEVGTKAWGVAAVLVITGLVAYEFSRSRDETGLAGVTADSMLVDLRHRLEQQGRPPALPPQWHAEAVVRPAGGVPFAGDFVVSECDGRKLEVVLVDVSGKGVDAGTRSLLLSGALGGLIGNPEFLAAANSYLVRQDWDEGFATAVHLVLELKTGDFCLDSAGHPPVAHFDAGSGRWSLIEAEGPALGLLPGSTYEARTGTLRPGDALLLYTDGLVEVPGRDLEVGIDKLLGEAERLVTRGFAGGGEVLVNRVSGKGTDDRGLVLLWRSHHR